jgi:hypothetical protein
MLRATLSAAFFRLSSHSPKWRIGPSTNWPVCTTNAIGREAAQRLVGDNFVKYLLYKMGFAVCKVANTRCRLGGDHGSHANNDFSGLD